MDLRRLDHAAQPLPQRLAAPAVFVVAAALFAAIAVNVAGGGSLTLLDAELAQSLRQHETQLLTTLMFAFTTLNSTVAVACYAAAMGLYQVSRRHWWPAWTVLCCVGGGLLLNDALKHVFQRPRPVFEPPLLSLDTYSFPSGHAAGSALLYGLLVVWLFRRTRQWRWRLPAAAAAIAVVALVGFSRVYLGAHFLSDVGAGWAEAVAWLALCLGVIDVHAPAGAGLGSPLARGAAMR